jgi:hypothetical protein
MNVGESYEDRLGTYEVVHVDGARVACRYTSGELTGETRWADAAFKEQIVANIIAERKRSEVKPAHRKLIVCKVRPDLVSFVESIHHIICIAVHDHNLPTVLHELDAIDVTLDETRLGVRTKWQGAAYNVQVAPRYYDAVVKHGGVVSRCQDGGYLFLSSKALVYELLRRGSKLGANDGRTRHQ